MFQGCGTSSSTHSLDENDNIRKSSNLSKIGHGLKLLQTKSQKDFYLANYQCMLFLQQMLFPTPSRLNLSHQGNTVASQQLLCPGKFMSDLDYGLVMALGELKKVIDSVDWNTGMTFDLKFYHIIRPAIHHCN